MKRTDSFTCIVIGLGKIGLAYDLHTSAGEIFSHTKACLVHGDFELLGGIDPDPERREKFRVFAGRNAYESLSAAPFKPGDLDLIIISTPTKGRLGVVKEAISLKPRALLIEKPLALTLSEAEEIAELCRQQQILLVVNYFRNFHPKVQEVMSRVHRDGCGRLRSGVCFYSGGILNNGSHFIALLVQWFGQPVRVEPIGISVLASGDADVSFRLLFGDASVVFCPVQAEYGVGELDLFFAGGRVCFENYGEDVRYYRAAPDPFFSGYLRLVLAAEQPQRPALTRYQYYVLDALAQALKEGTASLLSGENALETLRISERILHEAASAHSGA